MTPWGSYVPPHILSSVIGHAAKLGTVRAWSFGEDGNGIRRWSSAKVKSKLFKKDFLYPAAGLPELLSELEAAGFEDPRPSSYAWPWHQRVKTPRTTVTTNNALLRIHERASFPRAWQESWPGKSREEKARLRGATFKGPWHLYDLRSAYAWAATLPMPDPRYAIHRRLPSGKFGRRGIYCVEEPEFSARCVPPRFRGSLRNKRTRYWVTSEELEQLDVIAPRILYGIEFPRSIDLRRDLDWFMEHLPEAVWKKVFRAFWGAWGGTTAPQEVIIKGDNAKSRDLPTVHYNPVWSSFIVARINLRVAEWASAAAHVFSDSILVPHGLPERGDALGSWKLVQLYEDVQVTGAGNWSAEGKVVKHAGRATGPDLVGGLDGR